MLEKAELEVRKTEPSTRREKEVWQVCDDLWALHGEFEKLTGDLIRESLVSEGFKKGSPNEVYKYRKTWTKSRNIELASNTDEADLKNSDPISRAVGLVHEQIQNKANLELESVKKKFESKELLNLKKIEKLEILSQKSAQNLDKLSLEHKALKQSHKKLDRDNLEFSDKNLVLKTKLEEVSRNLSDSHSNWADLKLLVSKISQDHKSELKSLKSEYLDQVKELKSELKSQGQADLDENNRLKIKIKNLENKNLKLLEQKQNFQEELKLIKQDKKLKIDLEKLILTKLSQDSQGLEKSLELNQKVILKQQDLSFENIFKKLSGLEKLNQAKPKPKTKSKTKQKTKK